MTIPLPGQRAGQQPIRAAVATQRAIGRAVTYTGGLTSELILYVDGEWMRHTVDEATGRDQLVPYRLDDEGGTTDAR